ncbi:MAG: hypothetical protein R2713_06110 [Ilumatobacteraceae bacterium]
MSPSEVAAARDRLGEILSAPDPTEALWVALEDGYFAAHVPEIAARDGAGSGAPPQGRPHAHVHGHRQHLAPADRAAGGAVPRRRQDPDASIREGKVTFHHHEAVGARMTRERMTALGYEPAMVTDVARLVELSGRFHGYQQGWEDSAVRRYARDAGPCSAI